MAELLDDIISPYKTLWIDIKNKQLKDLPVIDAKQVDTEAISVLTKNGFPSKDNPKNKNQQAIFLDTLHKLTDQLHYIRDIKDSKL